VTAGTARATALGAVWNYGAQAATVVVQLAYAAVSARLLGPQSFGHYSAALVLSSFVTLLATAGLPQAVSRMPALDPARVTGLLRYGVVVGCVACVCVVLVADGWAWLWDVEGAAPLVRLLSINGLTAPLLAVGTGVLLRQGRFRTLAATTFGCNVAGMAVGIVAIAVLRSDAGLVVSPIVAQLAAAILTVALSRSVFRRGPAGASVLAEIRYSARMTVASSLSFTAGNIGKLSISNVFGAALLGHWNRAEVLTTVPFYQVQNAIIQALYPALREDVDGGERSRRVWPDLLGLVAWLSLPTAAVLAVVIPALVPVLFGSGWGEVTRLVPLLALVGGVQVVAFVLVSALEILARFRWVWAGHLSALVLTAGGGLLAVRLHSVAPVLVGGLTGVVVMHGLHLWLCHRAGLFDARSLLRTYAGVALFSAASAGAAYLVVSVPRLIGGAPATVGVVATVLAGCAAAGWGLRERLPVVRLIRKYGLVGA
jgi:O-antigen/teichoic acid export membrane protein